MWREFGGPEGSVYRKGFVLFFSLRQNNMGTTSRHVWPVCGSLHSFCPAMRKRSRNPVYRKLFADIFRSPQEESPCEICGSVDYPEIIMTCSKCMGSRQHIYCMRIYVAEVPETWICEACVSLEGAKSTQPGGKQDIYMPDEADVVINPRIPAKLHPDSGQQAYKKQRLVQTGKVKQISTEEVVRLSSGISRKESFLRGKIGGKSVRRCPNTFMPHRRPIASETFPSRSFPVIQKSNAASGRSLKHVGVESISVKKWQATQTASREMEAPNAHAKEYLTREQCVKPPNEVRIPRFKVDKIEGNPLKVASKCNAFEDILPKLKLYRQHLPAEDATWKGGFKFLDTDRPGKYYGGFKAQPPCRLKRKAYEFSIEMPDTLKMEILPHFHVLEDIFQNSPDLLDVALYFFPSDSIQGSKENYAHIVELMQNENSMLRCDFGDVELLVLTSKKLNDGSKDTVERLNAGPLLWGILHRTRKGEIQTTVKLCDDQLKMEQVKDDSSLDDSHVEDMDIDMIGGEIVGRVDVSIMSRRLEKSSTSAITDDRICQSSNSKDKIGGNLIKYTELVKKIKTESAMDFPPGFQPTLAANLGRYISPMKALATGGCN